MHGTYFVVAHFHYVLVAGSLFALFSGWYYWSPKWTGWMYNETRGKIHFWASMFFFNLAFLPMHFLGLAGMPRRYADYPAQFTDLNQVDLDRRVRLRSGAGLLPVRGCTAGLPWRWRAGKSGRQAVGRREGLEWTVPSPAPFHTFEHPPTVE